jgi:protein phosphatase
MAITPLDVAIRTHVGLVRSSNQDWLHADADLGILVLADGMGGHRGGEVASQLAVQAVIDALMPAQREDVADDMESLMRVGEAADFANRLLLETSQAKPELKGMGTTVVLAIFRGGRIFYAHVGDSRLYRVRYGRMRRLTRDHSLIQQLIDDGVFLNRHEAREGGVKDNILTRSLGMEFRAEVDVGDALLAVNDTYLFCSDGLHSLVPDDIIARILRDPEGDLENQAQTLTDAALSAGGKDNISVILARPRL